MRQALKLEPGLSDAEYELGSVLIAMGSIDEAEQLYRSILSRERHVPGGAPSQAKLALANLLLDGRGQRSEALRVFRQACDAGPSCMAVLGGCVADSLGDPAGALSWYEEAWRNEFGDEEAALHLMVSHLRRGDDGSAAALRPRLAPHVASSVDYALATAVGNAPSLHFFTHDMMQLAAAATFAATPLADATADVTSDASAGASAGLILECGVFHGKTIRMLAAHYPDEPVHGFDTFSGLPEAWHSTEAGSYSTHGDPARRIRPRTLAPPRPAPHARTPARHGMARHGTARATPTHDTAGGVPVARTGSLPEAPDNVRFHVGLFSETLPRFLAAHPATPIRLLHIDCDLYSSTKDIFDALADRLRPGAVLVFDEYVMNPHWEQDEHRAFQEAVAEHGWTYRYLAISLVTGQAVVQLV